ncbi:MAG: 16S rRNA (uracil(1498)-N(3))-methyltransferase [Candidatus Eremiobacteraeota bacterium]|nr:16S rRNA (uracil(1498)-N(3))-methyltransferase [Candidatus Eremiobacteraeota bacterium]
MRAPAATASKRKTFSIASKTRSSPISSRFFVEGTHELGEVVELLGGDARKVVAVLRMNSGDTIEVIDSAAQRFSATLTLANHRVTAHLDTLSTASEIAGRWRITLAQALPKGQKMDFVIEKATELGIAEIFPLFCERTVVDDVGPGKLERWRRLAKTAAQQCGRSTVPEVNDAQSLTGFVPCFKNYDTILFPWELAGPQPLRETLPPLVERAREILIIIGPEGGFSSDEAARAKDAGAHLISLGTRILRTETAALVVLAILNYVS